MPSDHYGACPLDCPDGCSWIVTVDDDGTPTRLRGNPDHPFTRGALCAKVNSYLDHTRAPDRLLHPLRRSGPKGSGRFERIDWDTAIATIAERFGAAIEAHGGETIWPFSGTGGLGQIQGSEGPAGARLWNVIGASLHYSNICAAAGSAGSDYVTAGNPDTDPEEFALARTVIFWGSNPLSTNHHIWKFVKDAHKVVVDPVQTRTARAADEHIALKPGTDAALALGLMAEIVALGGHDERFLAERASGWPGFRERLAGWSGERAAAICDVPYETIRALAERIATDGPTAIRASMGMQRHAGGGNAMRAVAALPVVTGDWGRPGGGFLYGTSYFTGNRFGVNRPDLRTGPRRALPATRLADTLLEEDAPPVTALFVYGANPAASNPDSAKVRRALSREDLFTVVVEHFQTDTADYADIVLPSTMQIEQLDVNDGYGHAYLNLNRPAVAPAGECLPHTEIFRRIAAAMGLEEPALYASDEELVDTLLDGFAGRAEMEATGWVRLEVPVSNARFELSSERARSAGLDPLPGYVPNAEGEDGLVLIAGASHWFVNTNFANRELHLSRAGEPTVLLHPDDAAARGLADGARVRIANGRGSYTALLAVSEATRRGVAATTKGWWPKLTAAGNANETTDERDGDMGRAAVFHDNAVRIEAL